MEVDLADQGLAASVGAAGEENSVGGSSRQLSSFLEPVVPVVDPDKEDIDGLVEEEFDGAGDGGGAAVGPAKLLVGEQREELGHGLAVIVDDKGGEAGIFLGGSGGKHITGFSEDQNGIPAHTPTRYFRG